MPSPAKLRAYALLAVASAAWAGNIVLGRAVRAEIPPMGMAFWRWALALVIASPFLWPVVVRNRAVLRRQWRLIGSLALLGMAVFHSLLYEAVHTTTAINATLILAISPILIPTAARLILGQRQTRGELFGAVVSTLGVVVIVARGEWSVLRELAFTRGDVMMLGATAAWSLYSVILRRKPRELEPAALLGACMAVAVLLLFPLYLWETLFIQVMPVTVSSGLVLTYLALVASLLAYYCYNRGVAEIGPVHAGLSINLIPVFTTAFAVLFLKEQLHGFHIAGILAIAAGSWLATRGSNARPAGGA
jgi:drug/metabolite transporter (DMT)-like permease